MRPLPFDDKRWTRYTSLNTFSIAFGPTCEACPFDDDAVWTGTAEHGITHSRLPYPEPAIDILKVCFASEHREPDCHTRTELGQTESITVTYTQAISPGENFRFEITVAPRSPYTLQSDRGDFLSNVDGSDVQLYGAYLIVPVKGTIDPGQHFTFTDFDNPFKAPPLADGEQERTFVSTWRVWTFGRYVGPLIHLVFKVHRP